MRLTRWTTAALLAAIPMAASAQMADGMAPRSGFYVGAGAGAVFTGDSDFEGTGINTSADYDPGWAALGALGYAYGNGFRSELELGYATADVDSVGGRTGSQGDASALTFMVNALYDFKLGLPVTPYVGAGIGAARVNFDGISPVGATRVDDSDTAFAYQGIVGASYTFTPQLDAYLDYRYLGTAGTDARTDSGVDVDPDYSNHRVMVGLRWFFGAPMAKPMPAPAPTPVQAPPPAAAPAPAPAPAPQAAPAPAPVPRTYLVFFDWDRSDLRADALTVVRQAGANAKTGGVTRIRATGHADRSGADGYNMALSQRRADAVKAELVRQGVAERDIAVLWKGEREPLVPTPDGVREPQNRRVEIVFE